MSTVTRRRYTIITFNIILKDTNYKVLRSQAGWKA